MTSPKKPTFKPSVIKMSVKPIGGKKQTLEHNPTNTSNVLNTTTPMPKPLTPHQELSQENNHPDQALPNPYIKDTPTSPQVVSHPLFTISPINSHVTHTQAPPQSDNQTQHTTPLSPSRESLVDDINQLQDLSNLLAMHLSQQQNNIPSSPYSSNLPHTLNINQVETHVGYCPLSKGANSLQAEEQDISPPTITVMKIPIIRKGEYDIWSMRMRQYSRHTDHNLWDVIVNGDLEEEPEPTGETSAPPAPKTAKQLAAKRNQERVKSILLLAIPDEYLLKFHNVADAKSL
ncbi:hypothetical protein Tco_0626970 [Tanacetum coccineum]|uniref:Uncharacterized protein n=1 Tax=Tanacetum coccineum TaxID=301880 RepID=A0ABQ4WL63_9ASTR